MKSVSVVMPARNAGKTIATAIESILAQTHADFEFILVNHKSTDNTADIMEACRQQDSRIKVAECHGSFIDACNLAWQSASGDLIARMDADDYAYPEKLALQLSHLAENPDLVGCATQVNILKRNLQGGYSPPDPGYAEYQKWINSVVTPADISSRRFIDSPIPNPTILIKKSVLEQYSGYRDLAWAEDYDLWLRLLHDGKQIGKVDQVLLDWFDGESRTTRTSDRYSLKNFLLAKASFIAQLPVVRERGVVISGAGPTGKRIAKFLKQKHITIHAFIEVNPRQIGGSSLGVPICPVDDIPDWQDKAVILSAVGQSGARKTIRQLLADTSFVEGDDFFCIA